MVAGFILLLMRCFFLDLASSKGTLACVTEKGVPSMRSVDYGLRDHELMPFFEELLRGVGWTLKDLTHLACVIGPGGFMSLRVAVSFANTLSHVQGIPLTGIHLSDLYAARTPYYKLRTTNYKLAWLHSTKRTYLFVRGFGALTECWPEPTCEDLLKLCTKLPRGTPCVGELLPEHRERLYQEQGLRDLEVAPLGDMLPQFLPTLAFREEKLAPWYGRGY